MNMKEVAIVTGVSGAGKTITMYIFEENGFYPVENVPLPLIPALFEEIVKNDNKKKIVISLPLAYAKQAVEVAKQVKGINLICLGLDCSKEVLLQRFKLNRRVHPLQNRGLTLNQAIEQDRNNLNDMRDLFTHFVDTSKFGASDLRKYIYGSIFTAKDSRLVVNFISFGYKKSVPQDVEMVFDTRILPNPYWEASLKDLDGLDKPVVDYIFASPITKEYLKHVISYLDYYLDMLEKAGRKMTSIGIACSGGQHRSVAISEYLKDYYSSKYNTNTSHRDLTK
jgi:RNase adapter protein RapZ